MKTIDDDDGENRLNEWHECGEEAIPGENGVQDKL
jgi:hypothetical protein